MWEKKGVRETVVTCVTAEDEEEKKTDLKTWMKTKTDSGISYYFHSVLYNWKIGIQKIKLPHIYGS